MHSLFKGFDRQLELMGPNCPEQAHAMESGTSGQHWELTMLRPGSQHALLHSPSGHMH